MPTHRIVSLAEKGIYAGKTVRFSAPRTTNFKTTNNRKKGCTSNPR